MRDRVTMEKKIILVNNQTWGKTVYKEKEKVRVHILNEKLHAEINMKKRSRR